MSLVAIIEEDLLSCDDFGEELTHYYGSVNEVIAYLYFEEKSEVLLDHHEYEGMAALVPMVAIANSLSGNITKKSVLNIDGKDFGVISTDKQAEGFTKIYLEVIDD